MPKMPEMTWRTCKPTLGLKIQQTGQSHHFMVGTVCTGAWDVIHTTVCYPKRTMAAHAHVNGHTHGRMGHQAGGDHWGRQAVCRIAGLFSRHPIQPLPSPLGAVQTHDIQQAQWERRSHRHTGQESLLSAGKCLSLGNWQVTVGIWKVWRRQANLGMVCAGDSLLWEPVCWKGHPGSTGVPFLENSQVQWWEKASSRKCCCLLNLEKHTYGGRTHTRDLPLRPHTLKWRQGWQHITW